MDNFDKRDALLEIRKFDVVSFVQDIMGCNLAEYQKEFLIKMITNLELGKPFVIMPPGRSGIPPYIIFEK